MRNNLGWLDFASGMAYPIDQNASTQIRKSRDVFAELIAADKEFDDAKFEFDKAYPPATHTRSAKTPKHTCLIMQRLRAAHLRRQLAILEASK